VDLLNFMISNSTNLYSHPLIPMLFDDTISQTATQLHCHRQYVFRTTAILPLDLKYTPVPSNCAPGQTLSSFLKRVIKTVFGKPHRERTPGLVINLVFIVETILIMKVILALVAARVGIPRVSIDIPSSPRIAVIRAIGVTIESVANEDFRPLTQTTSGQDFGRSSVDIRKMRIWVISQEVIRGVKLRRA
jgi:hypothetical protein